MRATDMSEENKPMESSGSEAQKVPVTAAPPTTQPLSAATSNTTAPTNTNPSQNSAPTSKGAQPQVMLEVNLVGWI